MSGVTSDEGMIVSILVRNVNDTAGKLLGMSYYRLLVALKVKLRGPKAPLLIWQMGKVGSKSVEAALASVDYAGAMFHVHVLSDELIRRGEIFRRAQQADNKAYYYNIALRQRLQSDPREWKIISLVREPVGRNISAFFQNLDIYGDGLDCHNPQNLDTTVDTLIQRFVNDFDHQRALEWMSLELEAVGGFDVYGQPFPVDKGCQVLETDNKQALILRVDDLNRVGEAALQAFTGLPEIRLRSENVGDSKSYGSVYKAFKERLVLDKSYMDAMYDSPYARHFYTDDERRGFARRYKLPG